MAIHKKTLGLFLIFLFFFSCTEKKAYGEDAYITINRFDKALYSYLSGQTSEEDLLKDHRDFLNLYGEKVIGIGKVDSLGFFSRLTTFFSNPELKQLYLDELNTFEDINEKNKKISYGFNFLKNTFDSLKIPQVYMHVSGLNQNIIVSEKFLSISADKYLGERYKLYADFFYDYQRQNMNPERIVPDYLLGFLMTEFPLENDLKSLLDRMIYEGKIRYILSLALPSYSNAQIIGYSDKQEEWCMKNESKIWKTIIGSKHLFSQDPLIADKYINEAPYTSFLSDNSPGKVGIWVGYQIVCEYMKHSNRISLENLIKNTNSQEILKISTYNP